MQPTAAKSLRRFLSTPSARRATGGSRAKGTRVDNFYPRPPRGGRLPYKDYAKIIAKFLSTPSARRATTHKRKQFYKVLYFYPRPPRGGRPQDYTGYKLAEFISIHALREEGDLWDNFKYFMGEVISIHALREEGDVIITSGYRTPE